MKRNKYILIGVILLISITMARNTEDGIAAVFKQDEPMPTKTGPRAGLLAPAFSLTAMDGKTYSVGGAKKRPLSSVSGRRGVSHVNRKLRSSTKWLRNIRISLTYMA